MSSVVRVFLVCFLVLLQLVAPLIHAHKNDQTNLGISLFHLPEFEQVNTLLDKNASMIAPSTHEGEIVTVSSGVRENQRRFLSQDNSSFLILFSFFFFVYFKCVAVLPFISKIEPIKILRFFNLSQQRAPPFATVLV